MSRLLELIKTRPLILDGAMGTMLQEAGMGPGDCPEGLNTANPEMVTGVHRKYVDAGADIITTNTFGGSRIKLAEYGLEGRLAEINAAAVALARKSAAGAGREIFVAADIGPTGKFIEPVGSMTFDECYEVFAEQVRAIAAAGPDCILIETMSDIKEARAAVIAAKENSSLPVMITMTFQQDMRTLLGTPPEAAIAILEAAGADLIGANCSLGPEGVYEVARAMAAVAHVPLIFQPNAGLPKLVDGKTVYPATPDELAAFAERFFDLGVGVIGSCCGSRPEHTRAVAERIMARGGRKLPARATTGVTALASRTKAVELGTGRIPVIIGERINPTGRKDLTAELTAGRTAMVKKEAKGQAEAGASLVDINVGLAGGDEVALMPLVLRAVEEATDLPVVIDSTDPAAIEAALRETGGKPLVNSVTGDRDRLDSILPLVKRYGAAVVGLTIDEAGVPDTAEKRVAIARRILDACLAHGIPKEDLIIDALVLTASAEQSQAVETLRAVSMIKERLGLNTSLGVSNISFGLPSRPLVNASYLTMALGHGLDAAMVNPYDARITEAMSAGAVLTGRDPRAEKYIAYARKAVAEKQADKAMVDLDNAIEQGIPFTCQMDVMTVKNQIKSDNKSFNINISPPEFHNRVNQAITDGTFDTVAVFDDLKYTLTKATSHDLEATLLASEIEKTLQDNGKNVEFKIYVPLTGTLPENRDLVIRVNIGGETIPEKLRNFIIAGNKDDIASLIELALIAGFEPLEIGNNYLIPALTEVGKLYEAKEFFLPQVMQSAETMKAAFARLKQDMKPGAGGEHGTVVLATVFGDVHDIGKNILSTLLENHGLRVVDLGKNVTKDAILDAAEKEKADVIGLSALMTTTMTQMAEVIAERDRRGMKTPVVLGGAVVTEEYAEKVGAAGSSRDALEAVGIFKKLIGR